MTFGTDWGWGAAPDEARKMLDISLEHGGNFVDTASGYTKGIYHNELERIVTNVSSG